jgi:hypothetical protein
VRGFKERFIILMCLPVIIMVCMLLVFYMWQLLSRVCPNPRQREPAQKYRHDQRVRRQSTLIMGLKARGLEVGLTIEPPQRLPAPDAPPLPGMAVEFDMPESDLARVKAAAKVAAPLRKSPQPTSSAPAPRPSLSVPKAGSACDRPGTPTTPQPHTDDAPVLRVNTIGMPASDSVHPAALLWLRRSVSGR